jgi:hypothetical protein
LGWIENSWELSGSTLALRQYALLPQVGTMNFEQIVRGAHECPLVLDIAQPSPRELVKRKNRFFYLSEDRLNDAFSLSI